MEVFYRYAPFIQDYIYRSGWKTLRGVQNAAGDAIFGSEDNVLLTASTASGKTEAAFFPILTLLDEDPPQSVGVLYIAPLKALINDQFGRLNELCEEEGIPVHRWHGDVAQSRKRKVMKHPSGILQITPESLESLMINKHMEIPSLFHDPRFIVIDEIHSLLRGDRGMQSQKDRTVGDDRESGSCRGVPGSRQRAADGHSAVRERQRGVAPVHGALF